MDENRRKDEPDINSQDLEPVIRGWNYVPGEVSTRWVTDSRGQRKIQMRVALGILQMEPDGRPDGERPHGMESFLEYQEDRLRTHHEAHHTTDGFSISPEECEELRQESYIFYLRYLCLFRLEDYERAARDTARNLRVLDMMLHHTEKEDDRLSMEQYRPYIIMMNGRALASQALEKGRREEAAQVLERTSETIRNFYFQMEREFEGLEGEALVESSDELIVLDEMLKSLREETNDIHEIAEEIPHEEPVLEEEDQSLPTSVIDSLKDEMNQAVKEEDYSRAASIRDRIRALEKVIHKHHGGVHG